MGASPLRRSDVLACLAASLALVGGSLSGVLPFSQTEVFGFLTGGLSVWLVVKQSIWTWPVGIANNVLFIVLFWRARLFADMGLQWGYVAISLAGWWYWLRGGAGRTMPRVGRVRVPEAAAVAIAVALLTALLTAYLRGIDGAAPLLDALTTALSLGAMYLMAWKLVENWWLWIVADLVYIPLYVWKDLALTGLLYGVFLGMCLVGLRDWRRASEPKRFGAVIGKFDPPHRGHLQLVDTALAQTDEVTVIVCARRSDFVPGDERLEWLAQLRPQARVVLVDQERLGLADGDTAAWADVTIGVVGRPPDVVFTGEDYGDAWAEAMGARHVRVAKAVPVCATDIRMDALAHLEMLPPPVRARFVKRVAIVGAESTGKSTLAADLAERFETIWAPEYGRVYSEVGRDADAPWASPEFEQIARVHRWYEDFLAGYANRVLFCDTDPFTTAVFHAAYLDEPAPAAVLALADEHAYDLFIVCDLETPFVQDGGRMAGDVRGRMHDAYLARLRTADVHSLEVSGTRSQRLERAAAAVEELLADVQPRTAPRRRPRRRSANRPVPAGG